MRRIFMLRGAGGSPGRSNRREVAFWGSGVFATMLAAAAFAGAAAAQDRLTVDDAVRIALARNPTLRVTAEDVQIARGGYKIARSRYLPNVSGTANATHQYRTSLTRTQ